MKKIPVYVVTAFLVLFAVFLVIFQPDFFGSNLTGAVVSESLPRRQATGISVTAAILIIGFVGFLVSRDKK